MSGRRLDAVVRVRALREQLARGEVSLRHASLTDRQHAEAAAWQAIRDAGEPSAVDGRLFVGRRAMLSAGVREADAAVEATGVARVELDHAADHWRQTARRLDGIERLVERLADEAEGDERRRDANDLDDLVVMRWQGLAIGVGR